MTDKEKIALGIAGALATAALGYLVWRHEHNIEQADSAAAAATQAQNEQQYAADLENALQVGGGSNMGSGGGGGYIGQSYGGGSAATIDPSGGSDSTLAAILAAFFPDSTHTATGNGTGSTPAAPTQPEPIGDPGISVPAESGSTTPPKANPIQPGPNPVRISQPVSLNPPPGSPFSGRPGATPISGAHIVGVSNMVQ